MGYGQSLPCFILISFILSSAITGKQATFRCNTLNPSCNLNETDAKLRYLTPYNSLLSSLQNIKRAAKVPIDVGPLIRNGANHGLVNIDLPLDLSLAPTVKVTVCGPKNMAPTIREAIICTVTRNRVRPPRGNTEPSEIGFSTQGRALLAARLGNPRGQRVLVSTQVHGNEAASTEAALATLRKLTTNRRRGMRILRRLELLFIVRVNVDGGEPTATSMPELGKPFLKSAGFFRQNVDPSAGGGFSLPTEDDFFGVVGRGYDLNRYNYINLRNAIRPVESQALVGTLLAYKPHVVFDAHGDGPKTACELDPETVVAGALFGTLPAVNCKPPAPPVPTVLNSRENMVEGSVAGDDASSLNGKGAVSLKNGPRFEANRKFSRSLAASIIKTLDFFLKGQIVRFSQLQFGIGRVNDGVFSRAAFSLAAVGILWEVTNFAPVARPAVLSVSFENGTAVPSIGPDTFLIEPCYLADNICIHELVMMKALRDTARFTREPPNSDSGYCNLPLATGLIGAAPASAGWVGPAVVEEPVVIPTEEDFGVPTAIADSCQEEI